MDKIFLTVKDIQHAAEELCIKTQKHGWPINAKIWGVPRGGVTAAFVMKQWRAFQIVDKPADAQLLVDDLIDSGATRKKMTAMYPDKAFAALFTKRADEDTLDGYHLYGMPLPAEQWVVFPWEGDAEGSADDIVIRLLQYIGEDPTRPGLRETPKRVLRAWDEWCAGYAKNPKEILKVFEDGAERVDELIVVRDIPIYSHCEHHLVPFFGVAHIGYIPNGRIVGLSKLVRLADIYARRLQVQERLTNQIADAMVEVLSPVGVGVVIECRHLCMESRGVCKSGSSTVTSAMRGALMDKPAARAEMMSLVRRQLS